MKICFLGGARYSKPLDKTTEKKFSVLKPLGEIFVIGFSQGLRPQRFTEHAHFYLLSKLPLPILRYAEVFIVGPCVILWLIVRRGVQVLVAQSPYEGFAAAWAKKVAGWLGRKVVLVVESHGDFAESLFLQRHVPLPRLYRFLMRRVAYFTLRQADLLRAISYVTKRQLEHYAAGKPIGQFPAWTDIEVFLQAGSDGGSRPTQNILYAGVLISLKGVHCLVKAFSCIAADFPQARLIIVGREEDKIYATDLRTRIRQANLNERTQFTGEVSQLELAEWMRQACVLVLPSFSEGLGRVVIEAMATGIPVIGSRVGGVPEIVRDGATGFLVPPGDEEALSERLRWILMHSNEAQQMGRCARVFAEHFFSSEAYVQSYRQIFEAAHTLLCEPDLFHAHSTFQSRDRQR